MVAAAMVVNRAEWFGGDPSSLYIGLVHVAKCGRVIASVIEVIALTSPPRVFSR